MSDTIGKIKITTEEQTEGISLSAPGQKSLGTQSRNRLHLGATIKMFLVAYSESKQMPIPSIPSQMLKLVSTTEVINKLWTKSVCLWGKLRQAEAIYALQLPQGRGFMGLRVPVLP